MQIKCIVIDDEPLAIEKLSIYISKISWLKHEASFSNAIDALNYLKTNDIDLIFLDIQMDEFSGIQFLESLKTFHKVIITSAYTEYAIKGYEFDVTDFLLKPFGFERFITATDRVFNQLVDSKTIKRNYLFIKSGYNMERVMIDEILYIEGMLEYLQIVTTRNKLMTLQTFSNIESVLPLSNFMRVHKSFIVAIDKIDMVERNIIKIKDKKIPVGISYKDRFDKLLIGLQGVSK